MGHLADTIKVALTASHAELWFPDLTAALVARGWQTLQRRTGITMPHYGTARVLAGDVQGPRHVVGCLAFCPDAEDVLPRLLAESLVNAVAPRYEEIGLTFYTPDEIVGMPVLTCLQEALALLACLPTLHHTVATLVRVCHLLKPADDDYDVSYSDPQVPFSIFVSIPPRCTPHDALRVAESLVHEAMHLQLTLMEQVVPLVQPSTERVFSPWKGTYRSVQGVLHALYVFRVIEQCFERLLALPGCSSDSANHMRQRRRDIAVQVHEIETLQNSPALTALGCHFVRRLLGESPASHRDKCIG